ncbi:hypothetical protein SAPIO_CDS10754 [Scedosporium apiospermum]|uniref:Uncharacterized protein n=1 Tax=Pseudallescheria apiosperma TaxID=563466 RepID=A0A084FUG5_PSEDA|nr:uncharacterized protein SAPIO_CDS10754 [Scedosporium apiospermum]KEZ38727.1 hypothetical protein SAPIO_CDS10754 [Scedosporium apiospermum]
MTVARPRPEGDEAAGRPPMLGLGGYAIPRVPIRVVLARDEEAAGIESETTKLRPPAYGLWRESVRVDPNRLFWQRNDDPQTAESSRWSEPQTGPRPPSYASDDGISYVVDAVPRSTAPTTDVPLPVHPSERGRWDGAQAPW